MAESRSRLYLVFVLEGLVLVAGGLAGICLVVPVAGAWVMVPLGLVAIVGGLLAGAGILVRCCYDGNRVKRRYPDPFRDVEADGCDEGRKSPVG